MITQSWKSFLSLPERESERLSRLQSGKTKARHSSGAHTTKYSCVALSPGLARRTGLRRREGGRGLPEPQTPY